MRVLRALLLLFSGLLGLLALLLLTLFVLLRSEAGSAWLLQQSLALARPAVDELQIGRIQGRLLGRLELHEVVFAADGNRVEADRVLLDWVPAALLQSTLHIQALELAGLRVETAPGAPPDGTPPALPDIRLPLQVRIDRFVLDRLQLIQPGEPLLIERVAFSAGLDGQRLGLRDLEFTADGIAATAEELELQTVAPHALDGRLSARIDESLSGADVGEVVVDLELQGSALQPQFVLRSRQPQGLRIEGGLQLAQSSPGFDLRASWSQLRWPLQGADALVEVNEGRLALQGVAEDYRLSLHTGFSTPQLAEGTLELAASGDLEGLTLQPLQLEALSGSLQVEGRVGWRDGVRWDLAVQAEQLDPGVLAADWPGRLDGRLQVDGELLTPPDQDMQLRVHAAIDSLQGTLRDQPLSAGGDLRWDDGRLYAKDFALVSGANRLSLDGQVDERLDLQFRLDAPQLDTLYQGLGGRLAGSGRLSGSRQQPQIVASLQGQGLGYQQSSVGDLGLEIDWRGEGGSARLQLSDVQTDAAQLDTVALTLDGQLQAHSLRLDASGPAGAARLEARGGWDEARWRGDLNTLDLSQPGLGEWRLDSPAWLDLGADRASVERLCLVQAPTSLCAGGDWSDSAGLDLQAGLADLELSRLQPQLPPGTQVDGRLQAQLTLRGAIDNPTAEFTLRPDDGLIRIDQDGEPFELAYGDALLSGRFADDRGTLDLRFALGANGRAEGRVDLGPEHDGARALDGRLEAGFPDLALLSGFVPALQQVQGRLDVSTRLGGTLAAPAVTGVVRVSEASAQLPDAGITLSAVEIALRGSGDGPLRVEASAVSGDGRITVSGRVDPTASGGPAVDLTLEGEDFQAVRLPEARVLVSPELRLQGAGSYRLTGTVRVPQADIVIKEVPSGTVSVSDDEIIIREQAAGESDGQAQPADRKLDIQLQLVLGDQVNFKGFGLTTRLVGAVEATVDSRGTTLDGKIELRDASYQAYGQDLTVEQGRLLFAGPPSNPELDLRAMRLSRDQQVKAYLAMSGPLSKPRPRVYSEPPLPEAEALAYLLTGSGLSQAGNAEGVDIAGAALSLGLSKTEPLLQDLSNRLGLDELRFDSGEGGLEGSSLVLGKYLNPDLYLGYSQGLFDPEGAVLLRLRLSERLELESRSGNEQSVDLFYRIEHD